MAQIQLILSVLCYIGNRNIKRWIEVIFNMYDHVTKIINSTRQQLIFYKSFIEIFIDTFTARKSSATTSHLIQKQIKKTTAGFLYTVKIG